MKVSNDNIQHGQGMQLQKDEVIMNKAMDVVQMENRIFAAWQTWTKQCSQRQAWRKWNKGYLQSF